MYIPLDMLEAVVISAVGGVAVEVGSSAVVSVTVSWQLAFPPRGVSWLGPG